MKPIYASAFFLVMLCGFLMAANAPYPTHKTTATSYYTVGFSSMSTPR